MFGATALIYSSKVQQEAGASLVKLLLERKDLDLDGKDCDGKTAEEHAVELEHTAVVQLIREERARRMGGVWSRTDTAEETEDEEEEDVDDDDEDEKEDEDDRNHLERKKESEEPESSDEPEQYNCDEDDFLQSQLVQNLRERLAHEVCLKERREGKYYSDLSRLKTEKENSEKVVAEKLLEIESNFQTCRKHLEDSFCLENKRSQSMIEKLEKAISNIDMNKILNATTTCSELECPICLEAWGQPIFLLNYIYFHINNFATFLTCKRSR